MKDKRILYVSSELIPYLPETEVSKMAFEVPKEMGIIHDTSNVAFKVSMIHGIKSD